MEQKAHYEWLESKEGEVDLLMREGVRIGEVSQMGTLWVSAVLRPSLRNPGVVDSETSAVKGAMPSREKARAMTLQNAQFFWDGIALGEGISEIASL
jgi:hypothetical protein